MFLMTMAAAAAISSATVIPAEDTDLHCVAAYLFVAGTIEADEKASAEEKAQVASLVTYYLGKLHGRFPGLALGPALRALTTASGFDGSMIQRDVARCNSEVEAWSGELSGLESSIAIPAEGGAH